MTGFFGAAVIKGAEFSKCRHYRYTLTRVWDPSKAPLAVIGLNPSTADEYQEDPTVKRCMRYARAWGHGGLTMLNLFGFRATDPRFMLACNEPVGPGNNEAIIKATAAAAMVLVAWGVHGDHLDRNCQVLDILQGPLLYCLGITKEGHPKHPLYCKASTKPIPYYYRVPDENPTGA